MAGIELGLVWALEGGFHTDFWRIALGFPLVGGGLGLVIWSVQTLYIAGLGTPAPAVATQKLVQTGPYRYSRNPMTLGAGLFYLGLAALAGSWIVFLLVLLVFISLLTFIYIHETKELAERFGVEYLEYRKEVPFLFPRIPR